MYAQNQVRNVTACRSGKLHGLLRIFMLDQQSSALDPERMYVYIRTSAILLAHGICVQYKHFSCEYDSSMNQARLERP